MEHPILEFLNQVNAEQSLLEDLLEAVLKNETDKSRMTAAKIQATRDIRFTLKKIIKENDHLRTTNPKIGAEAAKA